MGWVRRWHSSVPSSRRLHHRHQLVKAAASTRTAGSDLGAVEHVVFLMRENRSFDHYFRAC